MKVLFILFSIVLMISTVSGEVIIYDNISVEQYKTFKIDDVTNFKYLNEYPYIVYINGSKYGSFTKDEEIPYMDGSDYVIFVPAPVKNDVSQMWDTGKSIWGIGIFIFLSFGLIAYVIVVLFRKAWKRR